MKNKITDNLFELWRLIGIRTSHYSKNNNYEFILPPNYSWPCRVFNLSPSVNIIPQIIKSVKEKTIPNCISLQENKTLDQALVNSGFQLINTLTGMYLDLNKIEKPANNFSSIEVVSNKEQANVFATIAGKSFGYEVLPETINSLVDTYPTIKLYIGKQGQEYASCGLLFKDANNISGLHMIGTLNEYRGLGLGKLMTNKLLSEAFENDSKQAVLVASAAGKKIYSKLGFIADGSLNSYVLRN